MNMSIPCYPSVTVFIKDMNKIEKGYAMKTLLLKDLAPGDEFVYADNGRSYRKGNFLVLDTDRGYLAPSATQYSRFLYSYTVRKIVNHHIELIVIKKETDVKSQKEMGHFINWKFGVPVTVHPKHCGETLKGQLVEETDDNFRVIVDRYGILRYSKTEFYYELVPYKYDNAMSPRYPVCSNPDGTAFCNASNSMTSLDSTGDVFKEYPTAKLILADGTEIALSGGTTESLRQQFGR